MGNNLILIRIKQQKFNLKPLIMERADKSAMVKRNYSGLFAELPGCEILTLNEMRCVKGGDDEGGGGEPIIIIPPNPL
jgi:hypothetical protein